ncbi:MAG: GNAT family protein [Actinomycetota bacterium]
MSDAAFVTTAAASWASGRAVFAIVGPSENELLGAMGFVGPAEDGTAEIGYWVSPWARGRGVARTATRLICRWAFVELGLFRIEWQTFVGNETSRRVAESCGFRYEGVLRGRSSQRGERRDHWVAGLLRTDPAAIDLCAPSTRL